MSAANDRPTHAEIGRAIRSLRDGLTREAAAGATNIAVRTLAAWEAGESLPRPEKFRAYAEHFGANPDDIIPPGYRSDPASDIAKLLAGLRADLVSQLEAQTRQISDLQSRVDALESQR